MTRTTAPQFNPHTFLHEVGNGKTILPSPNKHMIFSQGDTADAVFYIQTGKVKLTVVSQQGKEAVDAILEGLIPRGELVQRLGSNRPYRFEQIRRTLKARITKGKRSMGGENHERFSKIFRRCSASHSYRR